MNKRTLIDIGMIVLVPLLMAYSMVGEVLHEFIGLAVFVLFIAHHILNRKWLSSLRKGSWNAYRKLNTGLNSAMFVLMLAMMVSALTISQTVFAFLNIGGASYGRIIHLFGANWLFVLMSVHLGLHIGAVSERLGISGKRTLSRVLIIISVIVAAYGCYALIKREQLSYLFMSRFYASFDLSEPVIFFILDYISIMVLFATAGFCLNRLMIRTGRKHKSDEAGTPRDPAVTAARKRKTRLIIAGIIGIIVLAGGVIWGKTYIRRHYATVNVNRKAAASLDPVVLNGKTLVIQFTRTGNTDFDEDVDAVSSASLMLDEEGKLTGNAELLAEMVQSATGADLYAIRVKNPYPSSYGDTVNVAGDELRSTGFPELNTEKALPDVDKGFFEADLDKIARTGGDP